MRLVLSFKGVEWTDRADSLADSADARGAMKTNGHGLFPFRQSPTYEDPATLPPLSPTVAALPQSNAILRHLARQHGLYGDGSLRQAADVDALLEAVESLRLPYAGLVYGAQLSGVAKASYFSAHLDRATADLSRNGGAHFAYLEQYLEAASGGAEGGGWAVGAFSGWFWSNRVVPRVEGGRGGSCARLSGSVDLTLTPSLPILPPPLPEPQTTPNTPPNNNRQAGHRGGLCRLRARRPALEDF